jgi:hypothetical protein
VVHGRYIGLSFFVLTTKRHHAIALVHRFWTAIRRRGLDDLRVFGEAIPAGVDLVAEARTSIIIYGNVQARARIPAGRDDGYVAHVEIPEDAEARLRNAEETFRELGARMQAFAATDRAAARVLRALGTDLSSAGVALIGLSNSVGIYGQPRHDAQKCVAAALGVKE